jgi:hypothetical protein
MMYDSTYIMYDIMVLLVKIFICIRRRSCYLLLVGLSMSTSFVLVAVCEAAVVALIASIYAWFERRREINAELVLAKVIAERRGDETN